MAFNIFNKLQKSFKADRHLKLQTYVRQTEDRKTTVAATGCQMSDRATGYFAAANHVYPCSQTTKLTEILLSGERVTFWREHSRGWLMHGTKCPRHPVTNTPAHPRTIRAMQDVVTYPIIQCRCRLLANCHSSLISATASYCLVLLANICLFDFWVCLLTPVVVTLSVSQAIHLHSGVSGPGHSEEQRVRLDHVRVAGFKLAAGYQQSGEGA